MKLRNTLAVLSLAALLPAFAHAAPIAYNGTLASGVSVTGSADGFGWSFSDGTGVNFWQFHANASDTVTLRVDRLNANFDPGLSLYFGTTSADASLFDSAGNWGGLTYLRSLDDEHPPFLTPGPSGDPFGTFTITQTGNYTIAVGGSFSTDEGVYPYRLTMTDVAVAAVPEPETYALMVLGFAAIGFARRRRK
jgi:hypothetical protein